MVKTLLELLYDYRLVTDEEVQKLQDVTNLTILQTIIGCHLDINFYKQVFLDAVAYGLEDVVLFFLENNIDCDLMEALLNCVAKRYVPITKEHVAVAKLLLEFRVHSQIHLDMPLMFAIKSQLPQIAKLFLDHGANVNAFHGYLLIEAAQENDIEMMRILISYGIKIYDKNVQLINEYAVKHGNLDMIKMMLSLDMEPHPLSAGSDPESGTKAFVDACGFGHEEIVRFFLDNEMHSHSSILLGFDNAAGNGYDAIVKLLLERFQIPTFIIQTSLVNSAKYANCMPLLLESVTDPRIINRALENAVVFNCIQNVKILLDHGADIHYLSDNVFHTAARYGYHEIVHLFLERGMDGQDVLPIALLNSIIGNHFQTTKLLLEHGADPNDVQTSQDTVPEIVELLRQYGANV